MIKFKILDNNILSNGTGVHDVYAVATKENNLDQIPTGPNPRDLDPSSKILKRITDAYKRGDSKFLINNGGMQIVVDDDSIKIDDGYLEFTCKGELTGHYDGQHTEHGVTEAVIETEGEILNSVKLTLIERKCFPSILDVRAAAQNWNNRTSQKQTSEHNILGQFDKLKKHVSSKYINNISWKQNQTDQNGCKIRAENEVQQLLRLNATFLPLTYEDGMDVSVIAQLAKAAEGGAMKLVVDEAYAYYMEAIYPHSSYCLELSDHIQKTLPDILGEELFNEFELIKQTGKKQLTLPTTKRLFHKQNLWDSALAKGALDKDYMPLFIHALINGCFEYDRSKGEFVKLYEINEAKAIWEECGREALTLINEEFKKKFTSIYKSRKADFVNQPMKWHQIARLVEKTIRKGTWRDRVEVVLQTQAA